MRIYSDIAAFHAEMTTWRRDFHSHPELGFCEERTAAIVATKLRSWGLDVVEGLAGTGVVATLRGRAESRHAIGLRADMDALPMEEANRFAHASRFPGRMHGCGHDGHTTMLLGAARFLAKTRAFAGTIHFIFQPAEEAAAEALGGADRMIQDGLFTRFPCDEIYGLHNWPELALGTIGLRAGPMMAAADNFAIQVTGKGGHGALPHTAVDPIVVSAQIVTALQTLISRSTDPHHAGVVSVTGIDGGSAHNVIPETVRMIGTVRSFAAPVQDALESGLRRLATTIAKAFGAEASVDYRRLYPALVNTPNEVEVAIRAASAVVGPQNVTQSIEPIMGSEDFASMLKVRPGAYAFLGQAGGPSSCMIHNPHYDFNDALLPIGASYWAALVEQALPLP